jgi:hypothetical protein
MKRKRIDEAPIVIDSEEEEENPHLADDIKTVIVDKLEHYCALMSLVNKDWRSYFRRVRIDWNARLKEWHFNSLPPDAPARPNYYERDKFVYFYDPSHQYTIVRWHQERKCFLIMQTSGDLTVCNKKGLFSTTTYNKSHFPIFDTKLAIQLGRNGRNKAKYIGRTDEEIAKEWDDIKNLASALGTAMHENIERFYNGQFALVDKTTKEWALFEAFHQEHVEGKLTPWCAEKRIFDSFLRICGSVDMLYIDDAGEIEMYDWKRSKGIDRTNRYQSGCSVITEGVDDCNYEHYSMQMIIYKIILERNYGVKVKAMYLLILHPNQDQYLRIPVQSTPKKELLIIGYRLNQILWDI